MGEIQSIEEAPRNSDVDDTLEALSLANATLNQHVDEAFEDLNKSMLQILAEYDPEMDESSVASTLVANTEFQQVMQNMSDDLGDVLQYVDLGSASSAHASNGDPILNALNGLL